MPNSVFVKIEMFQTKLEMDISFLDLQYKSGQNGLRVELSIPQISSEVVRNTNT